MTDPQRRLSIAFCLSLLAHALPFLPLAALSRPAPPPAPPPLAAKLRPPPAPAPLPDLIVPEVQRRPPPPKPPPPPSAHKAAPAPGWQAQLRRQLSQWYSDEAIANRLEGEVVVLFVLDESGNVAAARIEQGSGHAVLDRDALRAVRNLRGLPADAPREVLLPLRFRLRD